MLNKSVIGKNQGNAEQKEITAKAILFPIRFFVGLYELYLKQIANNNKKN